jgi:hypothetical protein
VGTVRQAAVPLLLLTGVLGVLRAFARHTWTASLRWLAVSVSALAALLVAYSMVSPEAALLLWLAACGGSAFLLAGEMRGASPRRSPTTTRLWRAACWTALASLAWPVLLATGSAESGRLRVAYAAAAAFTTALAAWIIVGRMVAAPERRKMVRPDPSLALSQIGAGLVMALGPAALVVAWWSGFEPPWRDSALALAPAVLGGAAAGVARGHRATPLWVVLTRAGQAMPSLARRTFLTVVRLERWMVGVAGGMVRALTSPLHDLHTGDAQEYLLFLVGFGILAQVLPLLQ